MFDRIDQGMYWDKAWTLVSGCIRCSPGCEYCWALVMENRFSREPKVTIFDKKVEKFLGQRVFGKIRIHSERLNIPLKRKKPTVWAIWNDLFHEDVPEEPFIREAFWAMSQAGWHTFLLLTKRAKRMFEWAQGNPWPENIWLGADGDTQQEADEKIPILRQIPAAVRFISVEPLLEQTDLCLSPGIEISAPYGIHGIHWVIAGGETGPGARPMHPDWARSVRDQCQAAGVPFLFKQFGEWGKEGKQTPAPTKLKISNFKRIPRHAAFPDGTTLWHCGKKAAGRLLDGREYNELPEVKG